MVKKDVSKGSVSLDDLIEKYVERYVERGKESQDDSLSSELKQEELNPLLQAAKAQIKDNITQEIKRNLTRDEYESIKKNAQRKYQKEQARQKNKALKTTLWESIFLAFFIGLCVNQVTTWIAKGTNENLAWVIGLSVAFGIVVLVLFAYMLGSEILKLLEEDGED